MGNINNNTAQLQEILELLQTKALPDDGAVYLPFLTNEGVASDILEGKEFIDGEGNVIVGTFSLDSELRTQSALISNIQTSLEGKSWGDGGGSKPTVIPKDVNFYDYDGVLLYSYTVDEAQSLTELPDLPSHQGLVCQGWNYDLETIKSHNREVDVGAIYITDDEKTRLYITIASDGRMSVPLYFAQTVSQGVTIDWGDGSSTQTILGTGNVNTTHTYSNIGDYIITLEVTDGCTLDLGHNSDDYGVMGLIDATNAVYTNMLRKVLLGKGITNISRACFGNCYSIQAITIPFNITSIGINAFRSCYALKSVVIPSSVTGIGEYAFYSCSGLRCAIIPNSVTQISDYMFGYSGLYNITIPNSITKIGMYSFQYCQKIRGIIGLENVVEIGKYAFAYCYSLVNIIIPDGPTILYEATLLSCYSLAKVTVPSSVTKIESKVFRDCYNVAVYDFMSHISIPTLDSPSAFSNIPADCIIKVPASLSSSWKQATNWSTYASQIVGV